MADWWLIPENVQDALYEHLWMLTDRVVSALDRHNNENGVTGALGQILIDNPLDIGQFRVDFDYRKFPERTEENYTGADGAFIVTIEPPNGPRTIKAALFQSKLLKAYVPAYDQSMRKPDAERLKRQVNDMTNFTEDAVTIFYTPDNFYVVDAQPLSHLSISKLCHPLRNNTRLISLATYLGKWLPRCTRGDTDSDFVQSALTPGGFKHVLQMDVRSSIPLIRQLLPAEKDLSPGILNWKRLQSEIRRENRT
jgi:hypothetical protein